MEHDFLCLLMLHFWSDTIYQVEPKYWLTRRELKPEHAFIFDQSSFLCTWQIFHLAFLAIKQNTKKSWKIFKILPKVLESCAYPAAQFHFALWQSASILKEKSGVLIPDPVWKSAQCSTRWFYCLKLARLSEALKFNLLVTTLNSPIG